MRDEDDMCFWLHPTDLSQSTIICSDKMANKLFVYDLNGSTIQAIAVQEPGNVDLRYGFLLSGGFVDIVAFNERGTGKIRVYKANPTTRRLEPIDSGNINTGSNYGFGLYKSPSTGKFYGFTGPKTSTRVKQYELVDNGNGQVSAIGPQRELSPGGIVEGMVADDETGMLYIAEEPGGIWKFNAEPDGGTAGTKIASVGQNGLTADVEGITIYYTANGEGYLIVSSQGNNTFKVYERQSPHNFVGTFKIDGVSSTDGLDVINPPLNANFPRGIFTCHNGSRQPYPVEVVKWEDIANALNLTIDTQYWDPRGKSPVTTVAENAMPTTPTSFKLRQSYPNPLRPDRSGFNPSTTIPYELTQAGYVKLTVYDINGQTVSILVDGFQNVGSYTKVWKAANTNGQPLPSGIYLLRMQAGEHAKTIKMILAR
jgi:3-phytase